MFSLARILRSNAVTCRRTALACALSASLSATTALAQSPTPDTTDQSQSLTTTQTEFLTVNGVRHQVTDSPDTASLFKHSLGYSTYNAGGVSSLPVLNGMADDRVATIVDGMRIASACPNHMNPAMSYIDPDSVSHAVALAGITPVSIGGDSTGGTVQVDRKDPQFAKAGKILITGHVRGDYRSNGGGSGASGTVTVANDTLSLRYTASYAHASDYQTGGKGRRVLSTSYLSFNHAVTLGLHKANHLLALTFGQQDIPYEGFPNQYMDMTNNRSTFVNGKYKGNFGWGTLEARGFWQRVSHVMDMMSDKGGHTATTGMPMNTDARTAGYALKATIPLSQKHTLTLGSGFDHNGLNDWWPPLKGSMMMGPGTFHNINNGHRDRLGHFAEWDAHWLPHFSTQLGLRSDVVMMNTGTVAPYSWTGMMGMADAMAAKRFNAASRGRTDTNFDVTATGKWEPLNSLTIEGGYARKTRSPNLYERYAWGMGSMSSRMIGWFGDGNGYVGNLNLKPEIANTLSTTIDWHDPAGQRWDLKVQPFYTYTHNYINVVRLGNFTNGLSQLQFVNHNARSYGINASGFVRLWNTPHYGHGELTGNINWVRGQDLVTHSGLYHQMPANGIVGLHETYENWTGRVEVTLVKSKTTVDWLRNEPRTPGYALMGLGGSYRWKAFTLNASIENLLNQNYYLPLGGLSLGDYAAGGILGPLQGMGRSFNLSLTAAF
ncbi:TonB-dependent receptor [Gluconobacter wancherniae]|uniref:TonB-dependent receptor n=1 Tax=Gluconobacter wancherniae NBRC 103581 TaxID=656744 RepID=A0A511AZW0_9PROT|nr:TonB-dependent receptor [Gluconobacter wancherniae]MBF0854441.1 TonB-dependent receptor [Gluconobacter wancherniae]GBD57502.1 TonB-dependent receptor [Gluconobacter wancherniae NBRC 103581]GBR62775.1 TonB-dependent IMP dehydrogenase [Gluconobacter wancherniae NBRC 103581]GEK93726.1 TonB-dependent receptor [Gluconobacter wancherniae NBRC 103581]